LECLLYFSHISFDFLLLSGLLFFIDISVVTLETVRYQLESFRKEYNPPKVADVRPNTHQEMYNQAEKLATEAKQRYLLLQTSPSIFFPAYLGKKSADAIKAEEQFTQTLSNQLLTDRERITLVGFSFLDQDFERAFIDAISRGPTGEIERLIQRIYGWRYAVEQRSADSKDKRQAYIFTISAIRVNPLVIGGNTLAFWLTGEQGRTCIIINQSKAANDIYEPHRQRASEQDEDDFDNQFGEFMSQLSSREDIIKIANEKGINLQTIAQNMLKLKADAKSNLERKSMDQQLQFLLSGLLSSNRSPRRPEQTANAGL
jgi:hypothetical protein